MAWLFRGARRSAAILKLPGYLAEGLTYKGFVKRLERTIGTYRITDMLADWRSVSGIVARKDVVKFTRRDRIPTAKEYADIEWFASQEWAYKLKIHSRMSPDEPLKTHYIMVEADNPLTPLQMESLGRERWIEEEKYPKEKIVTIVPYEAYHRISGPLSEQ